MGAGGCPSIGLALRPQFRSLVVSSTLPSTSTAVAARLACNYACVASRVGKVISVTSRYEALSISLLSSLSPSLSSLSPLPPLYPVSRSESLTLPLSPSLTSLPLSDSPCRPLSLSLSPSRSLACLRELLPSLRPLLGRWCWNYDDCDALIYSTSEIEELWADGTLGPTWSYVVRVCGRHSFSLVRSLARSLSLSVCVCLPLRLCVSLPLYLSAFFSLCVPGLVPRGACWTLSSRSSPSRRQRTCAR